MRRIASLLPVLFLLGVASLFAASAGVGSPPGSGMPTIAPCFGTVEIVDAQGGVGHFPISTSAPIYTHPGDTVALTLFYPSPLNPGDPTYKLAGYDVVDRGGHSHSVAFTQVDSSIVDSGFVGYQITFPVVSSIRECWTANEIVRVNHGPGTVPQTYIASVPIKIVP